MARYNVTKVVPEGFLHHMAFDEVIDSLSWSLSELGHEVSVTQNWFSEVGETNIILGAELIADYQKLPRNSIVFNLEQPSHPNMEKVRRLAKGLTVWDFSHRNVEEWRKLGYDVRHVPIGYTPNLTRIPKATTQDWDVCFFGWMTPRRVAIIEQLRAAGLKVFASAACYGGGRDNIISRSNICLNVHHDGRDMFEIVRVSYMMANAKRVVSEESVDDQDYFGLAVERVNYRALVDFCKNAVRTSPDPKFEKLSLDSIRRNDFTHSVAQALDGTDGNSLEEIKNKFDKATESLYRKAGEVFTNHTVQSRYERGCTQGDMKDFLPWMREHAKGNVMEIGVRDGASTSAFLLGVEEHGGHVYSVDVQDCSHLFKGHPQWTFIQANSTNFQEVIKQIPFELDLILVDGDHSRAGVISDFQYARQLRPGGIVLFHDIAPEEKPSDCNDCSWPGDDAKNVFEELSAALAPLGWKKEILPGKYGMGVLRKPVLVAA